MDYVVRHVIHVDSDEIKDTTPSFFSYRSLLYIYMSLTISFSEEVAFYVILSLIEGFFYFK